MPDYFISYLLHTITLGQIQRGPRSHDLFSVTYRNQFSKTGIQKTHTMYLSSILLKHKNEKTYNIKLERQQSLVIKSVPWSGWSQTDS